ncbi:MAG: signal peptide peptidase SppA [bacterium]
MRQGGKIASIRYLAYNERMKRERLVVALLLALFAFSVLLSISSRQLELTEAQLGLSTDVISNKGIAVVQLNGTISFSDNNQFLAPFSAESVLSQINTITEDKRVKGLLIRINSPGGTVGASQELYHAIMDFKEKTQLPVVASIADMGTSGAYYTAMAADVIFANPGSLVGSIGVILSSFNLEKLAERFGIDVNIYKSAAHKDILSNWRQATTKEKAVLNDLMTNVHQQFVRDLMKSRKMNRSQAESVADGRFFSGEQAKTLGLVDHLEGFQEALNYTAKVAGIEGKPLIIRKAKRGITNWMSLLRQEITTSLLNALHIGPKLQ